MVTCAINGFIGIARCNSAYRKILTHTMCIHVLDVWARNFTWWHVTCCPIWSNLWQLEGIRTLEECTWEEEPNIQWLTQATKLGKAGPQWLRQFHLNSSQYISIHLNTKLAKVFWLFLVLWDVIWNLAMSVAMSVAGQNVVWQPFLVNLNNLARTEWSCTNRVRSKSFFFGVGVHHSLGALVGSQSLAHICSH